MRTAGLIVAAGRGLRLGGDMPKQYLRLGGSTVLARAIRALLDHPAVGTVMVVINPDDRAHYETCVASIADTRLASPVTGGPTRCASVLAGLEALVGHGPDKVLIHDAARPFVSQPVISAVVAALAEAPAAFPALPLVDALWRAGEGLMVADPIDRVHLWRAQTPQGFAFHDILAAHRRHVGDAPDDVAVARAAGLGVRVVPGAEENYKITTAGDLAKARRTLEGSMDIRTGTGFDVHAFTQGNAVTLCGIEVPHTHGLLGHSDADVGMHALTDAIFGALAEGDIGQWFPPSDPQWKGAASEVFLQKAMERTTERGFAVTHLDCTLICETPKIGPHAQAMRTALARITALDPDRISVKATTSEGLGFTGRGEGIAAIATATLVRR